MTIGIIGAMEEEVTNLRKSMSVVTTKNVIGLDYYVGMIEGSSHNVVVVSSGIGKVNAALCAQVLVDMFAVDAIINTGVAGAISGKLKIGDVVVSTDAMYHDFDTTACGDEPGIISRMGTSFFPADADLIDKAIQSAEELGLNAVAGRIATGDQFISNQERKDEIRNLFSPLCCEMEGAAIAHAAYLNMIPFVIIRAISDNANENSDVNFETFFRDVAVKSAEIVKKVIEKIA
jgi:adenosylhomocysteine nucleosidase